MLRKILATALVLMMALAGTAVAETSVFNAEGYPIVNEPVTLRVLVGNSPPVRQTTTTSRLFRKSNRKPAFISNGSWPAPD